MALWKLCLEVLVFVSLVMGSGAASVRQMPGFLEKIMSDYSASNGLFSLDLYNQMAATTDNFAISPFSIHSALTMVLLAAGRETRTQLMNGLYAQSSIHQGFSIYNQSLTSSSDQYTTLMLGNAVYTRPYFQPKRQFVNNLRRYYETEIFHFEEPQPERAINEWVAQKTNNMITDFLDDGEISSDAVMMLLNAVYFKGFWKAAFEERHTSIRPFTDANGQQHDVSMMHREDSYKLYNSYELGATALKLPYKGGRYSMNLILPNYDVTLSTVESRLTFGNTFADVMQRLADTREQSVVVEIPKFSLDTEASLKELLQSLGITNIFGQGADFTRMTDDPRIYVSKVKHRCIVELDERGTEAAAVTGVDFAAYSGFGNPQFIANKPFMFVLRDDLASVDLFIGRYVNPQGSNVNN